MEDKSSFDYEVIVGTYEEFLVGYKMKKGTDKYEFEMSFTNHSHGASIRSIASFGRYVASGGADQSINILDMKSRQEYGSIRQQSGTITCLCCYGPDYLFSGCDDGSICIWKSEKWECEKTFPAHEGGVVDVSIHPSGKLALSVGKDKTMKTWNLIKGRKAYITNMKILPEVVQWSPSGDSYAVALETRVDIYTTASATVSNSIDFKKRVSNVVFLKEDLLVVSGDKSIIEIHHLETGKIAEFDAHLNRVKDMEYLPELKILVSASNDGFIKVWDLKKVLDASEKAEKCSITPQKLGEIDTGCRITKMCVWSTEKMMQAEQLSTESVLEENEQSNESAEDDDSEESDGEEEQYIVLQLGEGETELGQVANILTTGNETDKAQTEEDKIETTTTTTKRKKPNKKVARSSTKKRKK